MFFMRHKLFCHFCVCAAFTLSALLAACLDIPSTPDTQDKIESVSILVKQRGTKDSTELKINSNEPATLIARVSPAKYQNDVKITWFKNGEEKGTGSLYTVTVNQAQFEDLFFPDHVIVSDNNGNSIETRFSVTVNAPPVLQRLLTPTDGDTLYGSSQTPFAFEWQSYDKDKEDILNHVLEIDGIRYSVGEFTQVKQSGFSEGAHTYRAIVYDPYGDSDSSEVRTFYVRDIGGHP